jgi:molybdenum cofactor sulfurtransferase
MGALHIRSRAPLDNYSTDLDVAGAEFKQAYPTFELTRSLDEIRAREYGPLDEQNQVYLDYTGGGLYADSQLREHMALLRSGVFGNPHSTSPASEATTRLVSRAREHVLDYFNASPDEYTAIFTPNATGAIKLVGESYPFQSNDNYLLTFDNHNSVNGIREFAYAKGANVTYVPVVPPELRVDEDQLVRYLDQARPGGHNLFAYPAQSNFSGVQHSLEWIAKAQAKGWDVLVDCAAFIPTNRLDLSLVHPDFVPLSFYKIFGYPTGVGCLLARKTSLARLTRPWFAGGTITIASVQAGKHRFAEGEAAFEEGTINYLNLPAVEIGLNHIESIGLEIIHQRVDCLVSWLLDNLVGLHHSNGAPLVRVYGPSNMDRRGGTVAINFYDPNGDLMDHRRIEALANQINISLRTGCFCNPGASEVAHGLTRAEMEKAFEDDTRMTLEQFICILEQNDGKSAGAVRVSVGLVTNFEDVYRFILFARALRNQTAGNI